MPKSPIFDTIAYPAHIYNIPLNLVPYWLLGPVVLGLPVGLFYGSAGWGLTVIIGWPLLWLVSWFLYRRDRYFFEIWRTSFFGGPVGRRKRPTGLIPVTKGRVRIGC